MLWFVVVSSPSGRVAPEVDGFLASPDVSEVPARPIRHTGWSTDDGTTRVATWEVGPDHDTFVDHEGFVAVAGRPWPRRSTWPADRPVAEALAAEARSPHWWAEDELGDVYALAVLHRTGTGLVSMDPLGLHPLVRCTTGDVTVLGNRADLVARVVALESGRPARRDIETAAWLAFAGFPLGDRTGFEGVSLLPAFTSVRVDAGRVTYASAEAAHVCGPDEPLADPIEVAEELAADVGSALRHVIARTTGRPLLELTGGKDSRLVLAVALHAGLAPELVCATYGPDGLPDVEVARSLASACGLDHVDTSDTHFLGAFTFSLRERYARHLHRTCGTSELGHANEPPAASPPSASGLLGEVYRAGVDRDAAAPPRTWDEAAARHLSERRPGSLGLVQPELATTLTERSVDEFLAPANDVRGPEALRVTFTLRHVWPRWLGPLTDLNAHRLLPLYSPGAVRGACRIGHQARAEERVHRHLVTRAGPGLAMHPLANQRWRWVEPAVASPVVGPGNVRRTAAPVAKQERTRLLLDLLDEHSTGPGTEVIDVATLRAAIDALDTSRPRERAQVLGAMAGLMWLNGSERQRRVGDD